MSFEVFTALLIVVTWVSLPLSLIIANKSFGDEIADDGHH